MSALAALLVAAAILLWRAPTGLPAELLGPRERPPLELLALALRSGCGLVEALEVVGAQVDDIAGAHLRTVAAALRWGLPDDEAWAAVPAAWLPAAQALTLASRAGVAPAELLLAAAADVRRAETQRLEAETARLGVRVVLPLGLTFLPAFILTTVVPVVIALTTDVFGG